MPEIKNASMLAPLPVVPRTRLAVAALNAVLAMVFFNPSEREVSAMSDRADALFAQLESGTAEERTFSAELMDWHFRSV